MHAASFEIDPATGQITVGSRAVLDHETEEDLHAYTVTVTRGSPFDEAGDSGSYHHGQRRERSSDGDRRDHHADVTPEDDADTEFDCRCGYAETAAKEVDTYMATDPDDADTLHRSRRGRWCGADKDNFEIVETTGALTFKARCPTTRCRRTRAATTCMNVTVVATDDGVDADGKNEMTAMRGVVITVTNVEEAGTVTRCRHSSRRPGLS